MTTKPRNRMMATDEDTAAGSPTARQLVVEIAKERGYLGEDQLAKIGAIEPELRRQVEEALLRKDEMIGSAVMTLARNLYTSNARFVFELLQNADDNDYSKALSRGVDPYVSFDIRPDKVCIECNENGFTRENLRAICAIGKSSKVGAQGYIGEKGIGFKSVFMAAWKVHIQSNDFSFSFTHRKGDSGLGMVTPVWEETNEVLGDNLTRITLFLHTSDDPTEDARQRETITAQFQDLQDTILLFLRKLRRVQISFHNESGDLTSATTYSMHGSNPTSIRKTTAKEVVEKRYHVTKHIAQGIPRSENRTYSSEAERTDSAAEVVLAFPITQDSNPIVENQDVFAFLPMRPMGFKFLIHTDFVTEASRQGIVTTSMRNQGLLDGIADCFIKAVEQFCQHPTLQFQWMRWLPQRGSYPWDGFWNSLLDKIEHRLRTIKVLRTLVQDRLDYISALRRLQAWMYDRQGDPLFGDTTDEMYLSKRYQEADLELLKPYGLDHLRWSEIMARVQLDVQQPSDSSRMKNAETDNDWHSRAAKVLQLLDEKASTDETLARIRALDVIPLENGQWVSGDSGPLYFSHCGHLAIPGDLGLRLVSTEASKNAERRQLFEKLGVAEAPVQQIRKLIVQHPIRTTAGTEALASSIVHLRFLFLSEAMVKGEDERNMEACHVFDKELVARKPLQQDVYLESTDEYGPSELLKPVQNGEEGFPAHFIHHAYFEDEPRTPEGYDLSWKEWMERQLCLRRNLRLTQMSDRKLRLSDAFKYVEKNRSERLMGTLQRLWPLEADQIIASPDLLTQLRNMDVVCKGRKDHDLIEPLHSTYLPLPELEGKHARYAEGEASSFVELGEPVTTGSYRPKWGFLVDHLGVGDTDGLLFYLSILESIRYSSNAASGVQRSTRILDLYETIHARCRESDSFLDAQAIARDTVKSKQLVFVPPTNSRPAAWTAPEKCLWEAREDMQTAYPLEHLYRTAFGRSDADMDALKQFFRSTLGVPNASGAHYIQELRSLKRAVSDSFAWIHELYNAFDTARLDTEINMNEMKRVFYEEPLIYVKIGSISGWYTVPDCLWSSATQIRGKVALNNLYPDLEDFFVQFLGVQELTLAMAYGELKEMATRFPAPPIPAVKETIWALNSLLDSTSQYPSPKSIFGGKVFPVRYPDGSVELEDAHTEFAIVDRKSLGRVFESRAKFLDFSLDEIRKLGPFLSWLGLDRRYLSTAVKEISTVSSGRMYGLGNPDRDICEKAHGLLRIAVHFNSPRDPTELYLMLSDAEVYETDGISSELHLSQDGQDIVHIKEQSELHIREEDGTLKLYVPSDLRTQGFCYFSSLPRRFLRWMMTDPVTQTTKATGHQATHIVCSVLNASIVNVDQILEAEGIVDVEIPTDGSDTVSSIEGAVVETVEKAETEEIDKEPYESHVGPSLQRDGTPLTDSSFVTSRPYTPAYSNTAGSRSGGSSPDRTFKALSLHSHRRPSGSRSSSQPAYVFGGGQSNAVQKQSDFQFEAPAPVDSTLEEEREYRTLVGNVIAAAKKAKLPSNGTFDVSGLFVALGSNESEAEEVAKLNLGEAHDRDQKIGALGELFVFEVLSRLDPELSPFSWENWQSQIRRYVTVHKKYATMAPWVGRETAGIVYHDQSRALTEFFVDEGYFTRDEWLDKTPRYLIEVKTTVSHARAPFVISRRQFQRMRKHTNVAQSGLLSPVVYVIFRVYNVNKSNVGLRIYVDPEKHRQDGSLVFTEDSWAVTPK